jgi:hypothetical protein
MNRLLKLSLAVTLAATAWAILWPSNSPPQLPPATESSPTSAEPGQPQPLLPVALTPYALAPASGDPFSAVKQPSAPVQTPPPPIAVEVVQAPKPQAPAFTYRYFGQVTSPAGQVEYYLSKGDRQISVKVGVPLDDGFVVEAITSTTIRVRHPLSDGLFDVQLPAHSQL